MTHSTDFELFIDKFVPTADALWTQISLAHWNFATTGKARYREEQVKLQIEEHRLYENESDWKQVQTYYDERSELNPILRRQAEVLYFLFLSNQSTPEENEVLANMEAEIQEIYTNHRASVKGKKVSDNEIADILRLSDDEKERKEAWCGSKEVGSKTAELIQEIARTRNRVAVRLNFRDYYHFSLTCNEIDENKLFALFDKLAKLTDKPFRQVKHDIDERLKNRIKISSDTLSPWHYADPFFQQVPPVFNTDLDKIFIDKDVEALSVKAYRKMGMDVKDILDRSDLYERDSKNQHAFCTRIDRKGDTRILCNLRPNSRWMITQMHELGHAVYYKYLPLSLPYLLRKCAHTNSTEAIAMLMGRLPYNIQWLEKAAGIAKDSISNIAIELKKEQAASMLIFIRWCLVMLHFEHAFYSDPDSSKLSELWWNLVEKFQLVQCPEGRDEPDWASKYHIALSPVYYHNYVLGELTTSQLERWLERETGGWINNPRAGELLTGQFFSHGALYPWHKLIEKTTGEPLDPNYFVDQFIN